MKITEYKKKNGTIVYRANVYLGVDKLTGKKARTTVTANTKKGIKIKAREAVNAFASNGYTVKDKPTITTYEELVKVWWDSYKNTVKPNTRQSMDGLVRVHLLPVFSDYKLDKLTTPILQQQVNKWADKANKGEKGAFANYSLLHNMNKRILKYGVAIQVIQYNPANDVIVPRKQQKEKSTVKYLDNKELKQFLNYLDTLDQSNYENLFDVVLYKTLLATGCRISEALALEWSDIDFTNNTININKTLALNTDKKVVVQTPKSKSSIRNISIDNQTANILKRWKLNQKERFLMVGTRVKKQQPCFTDDITNSYLYLNFMNANLKRICKKHEFKEIKVHGFRHTHCSLLFESGITIQEVQERLGHSDLKTTMSIYAHVTEKQKEEVGKKFAKYVNF